MYKPTYYGLIYSTFSFLVTIYCEYLLMFLCVILLYSNIYLSIYLFIWLCWVLVAAHRIFLAACRIFVAAYRIFSCSMQTS